MELKNALAVCLISLFSATLVVLIAKACDSQAATRIEPQLARIVDELQALRTSGGVQAIDTQSDLQPDSDGLMVYYFHGNTRCPTCRTIESLSHETVKNDFEAELDSGELRWKILNYEQASGANLAKEFEIQMPVIVLARMEQGHVRTWKRLDEVWALVNDKPAFSEFLRNEINGVLNSSHVESGVSRRSDNTDTVPEEDVDIPLPIATDTLPE